MNTNRKGQTVAQALAEKNTEIMSLILKIQSSLYSADSSKNWGHVGDTSLVLEKLKEISDFFCK